jgi:hypothetical protein
MAEMKHKLLSASNTEHTEHTERLKYVCLQVQVDHHKQGTAGHPRCLKAQNCAPSAKRAAAGHSSLIRKTTW